MELTPTSSKFIDSLVDVKTTNPILQTLLLPATTCAICTDDFDVDQNVNQLPCSHWFHHGCILPWLTKKNLCPLCRHELPKEEDMMMNHMLASEELFDRLISIMYGSEDVSQEDRLFPDDRLMDGLNYEDQPMELETPITVIFYHSWLNFYQEDDTQVGRQFLDLLGYGSNYEDQLMEETYRNEQLLDLFH